MSIAMTPEQRAAFDEQGFIILEDFLAAAELERLLCAVDEVAARVRQNGGLGPDDPFAVRNALTHHEAFLDLIDHPRMLPLVVDAIGWNIQIRTTHLDYRPPTRTDCNPARSVWATAPITRTVTAIFPGTRTLPVIISSWRLRSTGVCPSWS